MEIKTVIVCKRCGRVIKSKKSFERGMGYSCWKIDSLQLKMDFEGSDERKSKVRRNRNPARIV